MFSTLLLSYTDQSTKTDTKAAVSYASMPINIKLSTDENKLKYSIVMITQRAIS